MIQSDAGKVTKQCYSVLVLSRKAVNCPIGQQKAYEVKSKKLVPT